MDMNPGTGTHLAIRTLLRQRKAEGALAYYIDNYDTVTGRTALEWQLAESIATGKGAVRAPESWPETMLTRPSGAALAFIVGQRSRTGCARPLPLLAPQVMPAGMRRLLACAWAEHPSCVALREPSDRSAFVRQLTAEESAIEPVLDAVLHLGNRDLEVRVAEHWLRHPPAVERASIEILRRMATIEWLAELCGEAVRMRIAVTRRNGHELVQLVQVLASLQDHGAVVAVSDVARGLDLAPSDRQRLLVLRLAALDELAAADQLIEEYRREWIPTGAVHPAPEQLLYRLHVNGADEAIEHLLASPPEASAQWIHLWRRRVVTKRATAADIAEWVALCRDDPENGSLLVGLTEAILAATVATRAQERETVGWVRDLWTMLVDDEEHGVLARAYLVLLANGDGDIAWAFRGQFRDVSLSSHPARRAAVAYVRALSRMREWPKLHEFLDNVPAEHLRRAFAPQELETHGLMARLADVHGLSADEWLGAWERLLALPLDGRLISDVLRHFIDLSGTLGQAASSVLTEEHFEDVHLQVQRRGCAEAERLFLAAHLPADEVRTMRARLAMSGLPGVREVIKELSSRST